ncbi:Holliday junction branch migration protein RuvA [Roseicyclus sp. F158]|uniref:Holliday junction branch migration complex subunit RuvA n=1 Tax=Tropicimonas omnivorans TaxID=3075590 RepID=A0ABU3DIB4_9RHOB|nr:Holliday junction branch migration protein RuvA [Roseicyclus sp. F158]MDT0683279.1 Holliday junction branch migration protein RuvA [Roseicyclus sp. F158]
MIGRVAGRVVHKGLDHVMIDVGGLGYVVYCPERVLAGLVVGEAAALWTELAVREDALTLYGFPTLLEREWHRQLISVSGIGAKASLAILGTVGAEALGRAIATGDWAMVKAAPGIGPKIAQRVVNELKDKVGHVMAMGGLLESEAPAPVQPAPAGPVPAPAAEPAPASRGASEADALSALVNLGYGRSEAAGAVASAAGDDPEAGAAGLIRSALKRLAPKE